MTSAEGVYVLSALPSGLYRIEVQAVGFETARETGVKLNIGQSMKSRLMTVLTVAESVFTSAVSALTVIDCWRSPGFKVKSRRAAAG